MPPRRSGSKSKVAAGMSQPVLSFQTRKQGQSGKPKVKGTASATSISKSPSLQASASESSIIADAEAEEVKPLRSVDPQDDAKGKRRPLDVKSKEWAGVIKHAKAEMAGMKPIHAGPETHNDIHHVLRIFDMTSAYGPYVGISRLQRWERAKKLGLNPPDEIKEILTTQQGVEDVSYRENVLHSWLG